MRLLFVLSFFALGASTPAAVEGRSNASVPPQAFVIGLSPYLDRSVKDDIYRNIVRLLVSDLPLNSTLAIYDAFELKTITRLSLPDARVFSSPKTRANQFAPAIHDLKMFLAQDHPRATNWHLNFDGAIRAPQFLDFLAENLRVTNPSPAVLLIGSPLYQDAKEPAFSMVDGYFPSDGHLLASREESVFGLAGDRQAAPLMVHWVYFGEPWVSDLHREKVTRFWTLYMERRGAQLAAFTSDLSTAVQSYRELAGAMPATSRRWAADKDSKIEMLRVGREVPMNDWLTRETLSDPAPGPPSRMIGPMKIGIRWKANIDLDLYATPHPGAETLFFQHLRSPEGYYYKDHRSSPGKEYEFIEFESPIDIREVDAFVNFYKGRAPSGPRGEVRIEFDGRIYSGSFVIPAEEGNLGRAGDSQNEYWTRIPVQELLGIRAPTQRAGY